MRNQDPPLSGPLTYVQRSIAWVQDSLGSHRSLYLLFLPHGVIGFPRLQFLAWVVQVCLAQLWAPSWGAGPPGGGGEGSLVNTQSCAVCGPPMFSS